MNKAMGILAMLLLASSASATVTVSALLGEDGLVAINYVTTDAEPVRAFALDIAVDAGEIIAVSDFIRGESTMEQPGYGIFPASFSAAITVDPITGQVADWDLDAYTPLADPNHPGALGGLGTAGVTLEMGALYAAPEAAPLLFGTLCKLELTDPSASLFIDLNIIRGGIVLNDATAAIAPVLKSGPIPVPLEQ